MANFALIGGFIGACAGRYADYTWSAKAYFNAAQKIITKATNSAVLYAVEQSKNNADVFESARKIYSYTPNYIPHAYEALWDNVTDLKLALSYAQKVCSKTDPQDLLHNEAQNLINTIKSMLELTTKGITILAQHYEFIEQWYKHSPLNGLFLKNFKDPRYDLLGL